MRRMKCEPTRSKTHSSKSSRGREVKQVLSTPSSKMSIDWRKLFSTIECIDKQPIEQQQLLKLLCSNVSIETPHSLSLTISLHIICIKELCHDLHWKWTVWGRERERERVVEHSRGDVRYEQGVDDFSCELLIRNTCHGLSWRGNGISSFHPEGLHNISARFWRSAHFMRHPKKICSGSSSEIYCIL